MDTQKLRQKILDLAIRGELVPQDPDDEPASVLLERIRAEKERLIAEGKIKRPKKSKASSSESHYQQFEPPFPIPDSWEWVRLEDIGDIVTGSTPSKSDTSNYGYEYPFYKPNDLEQGFYTTKSHDNLSTKGMAAARELPIGSVLVTCIGATIGKTGLIRTKGASNQQINAIIPNRTVDSEYLYYIIIGEYFQNSIKQKASSTTLPILNKGDFSKLHIPIPPKNEQKRIFSLIIRLFNIVSDIENAASNINESVRIAKSKILDLAMQGKLVPQDPADEPAADMLMRINPKAKIITDNPHYPQLPSEWCIAAIRDVFEINPKNVADRDTEAGFVPMASICDGFNNSFAYTQRKWDEIKTGFTHFANGDIAVAKISPCLENRKSMILKNLPNGIGSGTTELLVFRSKVVYPEYGLLFFKSDNFIKQCVGTFNGVVGQQRVGKSIVEEIPLPIPPYETQIKLVNEVTRLCDRLDEISSHLAN